MSDREPPKKFQKTSTGQRGGYNQPPRGEDPRTGQQPRGRQIAPSSSQSTSYDQRQQHPASSSYSTPDQRQPQRYGTSSYGSRPWDQRQTLAPSGSYGSGTSSYASRPWDQRQTQASGSYGSRPLGQGQPQQIGSGSYGSRPFEQRQQKSGSYAPRPPCTPAGSAGPLNLQANYFKLSKIPNWKLYEYHVDYCPDIDSPRIRQGLLYAQKDNLGGYLFDGGSTLWSLNDKLCDNEGKKLVYESRRKGTEDKVQIIIKPTAGDANREQHRVFNTILRRCLKELKLQLVGRQYYDAANAVEFRQFGIQIWPGYNTAINKHQNDILMRCDISHKVMRMDTALDTLRNIQSGSRGDGSYQKNYSDAIVGSIVLTKYNNKTYRIIGVDYSQNPLSTFSKKDGTSISYLKYYERYNKNITNVQQPLLLATPSEGKRKLRPGQTEEKIFLIPELCSHTGITEDMRKDFNLMKEVNGKTRVGPSERIQELLSFNRRLSSIPQVSQFLNSWDLELESDLVQVTGKALPAEVIYFGNNVKKSATDERTKQVDWTSHWRSQSMFRSQTIDRWVCIVPNRFVNNMTQFVNHMQTASRGLHMSINTPKYVEIRSDRVDEYVNGIEQAVHSYNPQLILLLTPDNKTARYGQIKQRCIAEHNVPSQVLLTKTVNHKSALSIATKVVIQLNAKLGGAPWTITVPTDGIMAVGYDSHKSFSAMTCTTNPNMTEYYSACSPNSSGTGFKGDFAQNLIKGINAYMNKNGSLPNYIIIYRSGISEGETERCLNLEVKPVKALLADEYVKSGKKLKLAFITVTKRSNARFFLNGGNPPAGTVVDTVVTQPKPDNRYDFFLISQSVRQGSVSPTHYCVLENSLGLSPEKVQKFTYTLTHMYYNWAGTVSVPAPCQYAQKLAFLTSQSLFNPTTNMCQFLYFL